MATITAKDKKRGQELRERFNELSREYRDGDRSFASMLEAQTTLLAQAIAEERERCAKICDDAAEAWERGDSTTSRTMATIFKGYADKIRGGA